MAERESVTSTFLEISFRRPVCTYLTDILTFISVRRLLDRPPLIRKIGVNRVTNCGTTMSKLTIRKVESAQGPTRLVDEHGLYLSVSPRGAKMWIQRLTIQGRRTDNGIGHYPAMGLAEARAAAFERWKIAKAGGDPREAGSRPAAPTFAEAAPDAGPGPGPAPRPVPASHHPGAGPRDRLGRRSRAPRRHPRPRAVSIHQSGCRRTPTIEARPGA